MRILLFIFCLLFVNSLFGQYPDNPRKQRLGYQTTGAGLVYIQSGAPTHTPADEGDAWMTLDTTNSKLYYYDEPTSAWNELINDVVRDTVFQITNVSDTTTISPIQLDVFVNSTADTLGLYNGVQWVMFFGGGGAGDNLGDHILDQNLETDGFWLSRDGTSGEGIFLNIDGDVGIDEGTPQQDLHVQGTVRITDVSGTPTTVTGRDGDGDIGNVALGNGLSLTSGTLNYVIDSTRIVQDSIAVYYQDGSEVGRDTIPVGNGGGGGGTDDQVASEVPITDAGGYYAGTEVETALQEVGADLAATPTGTGQNTKLAYWTSANNITFADNLYYNSTSGAFAVGTTSPTAGRAGTFYHPTASSVLELWTGAANRSCALVLKSSSGNIGVFEAFGPSWATASARNDFSFTNQTATGDIIFTRYDAPTVYELVGITGSSSPRLGVGTHSPAYSLDVIGTDGVGLTAGTDAQRGAGRNGLLGYNTTHNYFNGYGDGAWHHFPWMDDGLTQLGAENYNWNIDQTTTGLDDYRMAYNETNDELELVPTALSTRGVLYETVTTGFTPLSGAWVRYAGFLSTALENFTATDSTLTYTGAETITAKISYTGSMQLNPTSSGTYRVRLAVYENTTLQGASECDTQIVVDAAETWKLPVAGQTLVSLSTNDVISLKHIGDSSANPSFVTCYLLVEAL